MTNSNVVPFSFDGNAVRVVVIDDDPWWVLTDVCKVLEIGNPSDVARRLDDDDKDALDTIDPIGRSQRTVIVNESGLYAVIFESRKPIARRFKKWVTSEVLPSIRKTGSYHLNPRDDLLAVVHALVEPIKGRFTEHQGILDNHEGRLFVVENKIIELDQYKRTKLLPKDQALMCSGVALLGGYCSCCGQNRILEDNGNIIRVGGKLIAEFDHHYKVGKITIDLFWLICTECHRKLTHPQHNPTWPRHSVDARFRAFQEKIAPVYLKLQKQGSFNFGK